MCGLCDSDKEENFDLIKTNDLFSIFVFECQQINVQLQRDHILN
jgi:hypothetical protein